MDDIDVLIVVTTFSVISTLCVTFGIGWFRATRRIRALERELIRPEADEAVARLQDDLVHLSADVTQLAGGVDYLSRLVTERIQPPRSTRGGSETRTPQ